jgi:hypothetical protein
MFVVWGRKLTYSREGYAADFCELCRSIQAFGIKLVQMRSHIYHICYGQGDVVGYERTCQSCNITMNGSMRGYSAFAKKIKPMVELQAETFPDLEKRFHERLQLEEKARGTPALLSSEERLLLIQSPFLLLSPTVEKHFAATNIDKEVAISIVVALMLLFFGPPLLLKLVSDVDATSLSPLVFLAIGLGLVAWQAITSRRRFFKRRIIPMIVKSLRSLHPTKAELESVLTKLARANHKIGLKLKIEDLQEQFNASAA